MFQSKSSNDLEKGIWSIIERNPKICLRIFPSLLTEETPGFDPDFHRYLLSSRVVTFEPDHFSRLSRDFYCRRIPTMRWHKSPPLNILPLRYVFGFSKQVDKHIISMVDNQ